MSALEITETGEHVEVRLNRPEKRNAIDQTMVDELHAVCADLERRPRPMLLTGGDDGVFAAGADIAQLRDRTSADALRAINAGIFDRMRRLPLPTVAAIDGPALGGGAELAYACDIRICTTRAFFGQPEARLGIIAGAGATWRLPRLVGESLAKELLFTGRRMLAEEALSARLVSSVVEPGELLDAARAMIARIAKASPMALRLTKLAVDAPEGAHPQVELAAQAFLFDDDEKHRRMTEFLTKKS
ncbi:enoyl-CoA hydratase/isomerase family protein [Stackebrandtia soli]|uniref:enoyl-CoA hydratase/isomerase family protein n=1 Tax=Stackebrandtia soli TaxID=1892856 RepID=UPI0039ED04CD